MRAATEAFSRNRAERHIIELLVELTPLHLGDTIDRPGLLVQQSTPVFS